jgi:hypothetical protein
LVAEAELRRAMTMPAGGLGGRRHPARLALVAQALTAVGAVGADVADEIRADVGLAVAARRQLGARGPGPERVRPAPRRASWRVVPTGQVIKVWDGEARIDLGPQDPAPAPDVAATPDAHSPGELLLEVIGARILTAAAPFSHDNPGQSAATDDLRALVGDGPGHIVAALHAVGLLPGKPRPRAARRAVRPARYHRPRHHRTARRRPARTLAQHADSPPVAASLSRRPPPPS